MRNGSICSSKTKVKSVNVCGSIHAKPYPPSMPAMSSLNSWQADEHSSMVMLPSGPSLGSTKWSLVSPKQPSTVAIEQFAHGAGGRGGGGVGRGVGGGGQVHGIAVSTRDGEETEGRGGRRAK